MGNGTAIHYFINKRSVVESEYLFFSAIVSFFQKKAPKPKVSTIPFP
jgi:hypothetical protein